MISCYPCVTRYPLSIPDVPAPQALLALEPLFDTLVLGGVVLNHPTIKRDVRTLHAGEYSASMQGQANPHPHSIVMVPSTRAGGLGQLSSARP